ncbi:hypothetical protein [Acinetobacter nosocomialis]|uniref:hypothetical protein n=1 Tax=Acinetobacter nosocomialis TaxID=106654 RepID=UPI000A349A1C|nr:hypothetical protein [Acinetobacter nosocomialis]OTL15704.1 hypothetical protein B9X80_04580 [Acinetobacter nosocomialis]
MSNEPSLQEVVLKLMEQTNKLLDQNNKLIEQNSILVQVNAEQSAQLSAVLEMFEDGEPTNKSKSLDG